MAIISAGRPMTEGAVTLVEKERIISRVVGKQQVELPIAVRIDGHNSQRFGDR